MTGVASLQRLLIIPAAGSGSRLRSDLPKFLTRVGGRTMLAWLVDLYQPHVSAFVVVTSPEWAEAAREVLRTLTERRCDVVVQAQPTGMLDAVRLARPVVESSDADRIWITWCDQVAVHRDTIEALTAIEHAAPALAMPVVRRARPYIHFDRDATGRITAVRQRREGDVMPEAGEGDVGLFSLSRLAFLDDLTAYAAQLELGAATGERNLLPFIPWLAARAMVATFRCTDEMEAIGINTPEELRGVETYLAGRGRA